MNLNVIFKDLVLVILTINLLSLYIYYRNILGLKTNNQTVTSIKEIKDEKGADRGTIIKNNIKNQESRRFNLINLNNPLSNQKRYKNLKCKFLNELNYTLCVTYESKFSYDRPYLSKLIILLQKMHQFYYL